jgi:ankyrin repeat protein
LHLAAEKGDARSVQLLIQAKVDVGARNLGGETPLMRAAMSGRFDAARLLMDAGADLNATNARGETAMALAARYKQPEILKLLTR